MKTWSAGDEVTASDLNNAFVETNAKTFYKYFGDGSDGTYTLNADQGAVTGLFSKSGTEFTLLKDAQFVDFTIDSGFVLKTNGYYIRVSENFINNGTIRNNGTAGGNAVLEVGGSAGVGGIGNTLEAGKNGQIGGAGKTTTNGANDGVAGTNANPSLGSNGSAGGKGGATTGSVVDASDGGPAGTATPETLAIDSDDEGTITFSAGSEVELLTQIISAKGASSGIDLSPSAGSGSGGGGSFVTPYSGYSGAGGGSGGTGGIIVIYAFNFLNNGTIEANGGNGGNGSMDQSTAGGGGGGGAGGSGGVLVFVYHEFDDNGTIQVLGGTGGTGATASQYGFAGVNGSNGLTGKIYKGKINFSY